MATSVDSGLRVEAQSEREPIATRAGWEAMLSFSLRPRAGRTRLFEQSHRGPLRIQREFHPTGDGTAHVYLLHPPGGVVGGDSLQIDGRLSAGAKALITTPGATKIYRSLGPVARIAVRLSVEADGLLEYLPQETILFDGANAELSTMIDWAAGARFLAWEVLCFGRPASVLPFERGRVRTGLEVWRGATPLFVERGTLGGSGAALSAPWGLMGHAAIGTLLFGGNTEEISTAIEALVPALSEITNGIGAVSQVSGVGVVRVLGPDGIMARQELERARSHICNAMGLPSVMPAIWRT